jgi:hypothetical protein
MSVGAAEMVWVDGRNGLHRLLLDGGTPQQLHEFDGDYCNPHDVVADARDIYWVSRRDSRHGSTAYVRRFDRGTGEVTLVLEDESGQRHRLALDDQAVYLMSWMQLQELRRQPM